MRKRIYIIAAVSLVLVVGTVGTFYERHSIKAVVQEKVAQSQSVPKDAFPAIDETSLTATEKQLLAQLKTEYAKKPVSFDANVLAYTDGAKEPWCADFVSWNMKQLGQPFVNPNSGGWRIPGVYTLREYYQAQNRWTDASTTFVPKFGDVAIYAKTPSQSHTNFVLSADAKTGKMVTIGGNEEGRVRVKTKFYTPGHEDLAGFGHLQSI